MKINPAYIPIGQIFKTYLCEVPRFQRGYTWDDTEILDFLKDVTTCFQARKAQTPREHFLGGVVGVVDDIPGSIDKSCGLIDGQQRITTFVLFARALELAFLQVAELGSGRGDVASHAKEWADSLRRDYLKQRLEVNRVFKDVDRLTLSEPDRTFFATVLNQAADTTTPGRESHQRLKKALEMISDKVKQLALGQTSARKKVDALAHLGDVLRKDLSIILIPTEDRTDAYRLFQVLNDRGTNLSEGDLLRASTLEMLSGDGYKAEHDQVAGIWDEILAQKPGDTEKFLRCYYSSEQGERPGQSSLYDDFMKICFPPYAGALTAKTQVKKVTQRVAAMLTEFRRYRQLVDGVWPYQAPTTTALWEKERLPLLVSVLEHELCHPLLLAACHLDEKKFSHVVMLIERIAFRYKYICGSHVTPLTNVYLKQAQLIRSTPTYNTKSLQEAFHELQEKRVEEAQFRADMEHLSYKDSGGNKPLKYFLLTADYYWRWFEAGAQGAPKCQEPNRVIDADTTTIEHIYSQSPGNSVPSLNPLVNDLGNLTLLSQVENDRVANKEFAGKVPVYRDSSFLMNQRLAQRGTWTAADLALRRKLLIDLAVKVFHV